MSTQDLNFNVLPPGKRISTPWGWSDQLTKIADGIYQISTPGHGGLFVDLERRTQMPEAFQKFAPWFEEDIECNMVVLSFPEAFANNPAYKHWTQESALQSMINWMPDETRAAGYTFADEDSMEMRQRNFYEVNKDKFLVVCAHASSQFPKVIPADMVGVTAVIGGNVNLTHAKREHRVEANFLVPKAEYDKLGGHLVIDPDRHQKVGNDAFTRKQEREQSVLIAPTLGMAM